MHTDDNQTKSSSHHPTSDPRAGSGRGRTCQAWLACPQRLELGKSSSSSRQVAETIERLRRQHVHYGKKLALNRMLHALLRVSETFRIQTHSTPIKPHNGHVHHCKFLPHVSCTSFLSKLRCMHTAVLKNCKFLVSPPLTNSNLISK